MPCDSCLYVVLESWGLADSSNQPMLSISAIDAQLTICLI